MQISKDEIVISQPWLIAKLEEISGKKLTERERRSYTPIKTRFVIRQLVNSDTGKHYLIGSYEKICQRKFSYCTDRNIDFTGTLSFDFKRGSFIWSEMHHARSFQYVILYAGFCESF